MANKKNTETKNKKSDELEQKKPTQKKKLRLHSHLKVNIPLFQSLMMIFPSLAKHSAAESIDNSSGAADQVTANSVTEKDVTDDHTIADSSAVTYQEAQTSESDVNSTLSANHAPHGSSSHLVPSHHLSTISHPQVHYIPSVSMPTISSGSNGQPTHSNASTTPALPVTFMPEVIKGTYGELHVDANGQYTFVLTPKSPQYILLNQHQQGTDHFLLHLSNGSSVIVQVPVTGKQDTPSISGDLTGVVTEDHNIDSQGLLHANGKIDVVDPDQNESSVIPEVISGKYGSLTIDADGHWQYQVDNSLSNVQALTGATSLHESFTIHTKDGTPQILDMTIGGNDDNAVITGVDAGTVTEDLTTQVQGQLSVTDSDLGEDHFQASQVAGNFGTLIITKDGAWTYDLDNTNPTVQALGQGATATDTITVQSADGTPHQVTITINGTNDRATVSSATITIDETNRAVTTSGMLTSTDVDNPDNTFTPDSISVAHGDLTIDANGHWTFTANSPFNQLNVGDKVEETFTVASVDGTTSTIKVTINGTNDAAAVSTATVAVDETDTAISTSGTLTSTDVDNPDNPFTPDLITGTNGDLTIDANGHWTFTANSAFNQLNVGDKVEETFTVASVDGTPSAIKVRINGTNDKATVSSATVAINETDKAVTTSGTLTSTDVDNPDNTFTPDSISGAHGDLTIDANGHWTFTANSAFNQLNVGDKVEETFTVSSIDGMPSTIKVTINGTNDKALIAGGDTASLEEFGSHASALADMTNQSPDYHQVHNSNLFNQVLSATGHLTVIDPDSGEAEFQGNTNINGQYGHLSLFTNGNWVYEVSAGNSAAGRAIDKLGEGEELTETITIHSKDGTPHDIVITIHGDNDRPYCSSEVQLNSGTEDTRQTITVAELLQNTVDVDHNDTGLLTIENLHANHGSIAINKDGSFSFTPEKDYNGDVHFTYDVKDAHGGVTHTGATTSLVAVADSAKIGGTDTASLEEFGDRTSALADMTDHSPDYHQAHNSNLFNQVLSATGHLTVIDPDSGEAEFQGNTNINGQYGHLSLFTNGNWVYEVSAGNSAAGRAIDKLGEGEELTETITIHSKDGTPHDIVITIHGDNDRPYCSSEVQLNSGTEDTRQTITVAELLQNTVDVDHNDTGLLTIENLHANHGSIAINKDGSFSFTPEKDYNGDVHFTYDVKDAHGGVTHTGATTNLAAVGDAAIITGDDKGDVSEHQNPNMSPDYAQPGMGKLWNNTLHESGQISITDADAGEASFVTHGSGYGYHGQLGKLHLKENGVWSYVVDNNAQSSSGRTIDALGAGETITDTITVESKDGTTHDITITIHGDNDRPYCSSEVTLNAGTEDTRQNITVADLLKNTVDVDHNDTGLLTIENLHANHGSIAINKDGSFSFTPEKDYNGDVHFTYDVKDAHGGVTTTGANIDLQAVADGAIISGVDAESIIEDHHIGSSSPHTIAVSGLLTVTDPDTGQDHFRYSQFGEQEIHDPFGGDLRITPSGNWGYSVKNSALQYLHEGDVVHVVYRVHSEDGTSHDITITVTGTNDAPVLAAQTQSVTEDGSALQGQMQATDADYNAHAYLSFSITNPVDGLTFNSDGSYTFDPSHASYQHLGSGQDQTITIPVIVKDEVNATSTQNLTIIVHGTNDGAIITGQNHGAVVEDYHVGYGDFLVTQGILTSHDSDNPDDSFTGENLQTLKNGSSAAGVLQMGKSGIWIYTIDNKSVQSMAEGETKTEIFEVKSIDGTTHEIEVTVTGTNDAPVLGVTQTTHSSGTLTETDVDTSDTHTFSVVQGAGHFGTLSVDPQTGAYTYSPNGSVQGMHYNPQQGHYVGDDTFEIKVVDNHGAESSKFITFNAQGFVTAPTGTGPTPTVTTSVPSPAIVTPTATATGANPEASNAVTLDLANSSDSGNSQTDNLTNDTTPTIDGHTDIPFSKVTIYDGTQNAIGHGTSDASGDFSITVSTIGVDGVDAEGNIVQDHSGAYSVDKAPIMRPAAPVVQQQHVTGGTGVTIHSTDTHGGFALNQYGGADIRSPYGTAHIDEHSGHVSFRPIGTGNPHTAHHGHFEIFQHGQHVADVDVTSYNHNHQPSQITVTPVGPPPPPPTPGTVQHDEPDPFADSEVMITESDNSHLHLTKLDHQELDQKTSHHGAAAYLDALGIKPDATSTTVHDQPADMDIVLAQVDQQDAATHDQAHLDMSDALEHHDANVNHNQDDEYHHHNDVDGLSDIDPNS
ncbi:hypothetical protein MACH09_47240 [Vibrio sp. MACH09]|uniref:VCBS domain-containing protein n=1 Tax=Vibrio sp. MACH09 TaxID=3025122 RepID=UPI00278DCABA|nr:VCBS domain-containing protein [Vibrio sp. MACH09]GLO64216.1 hypothetical protein MACH09_47240 [Vibrio sp. MACH09]